MDGAAPPRKVRKTTRSTPIRQRGDSDSSARSRMQADSDLRSTSRALTVFSKVIILATLAAQDCVQDLGPVCALVGVASQLHTRAGTCEPPPSPREVKIAGSCISPAAGVGLSWSELTRCVPRPCPPDQARRLCETTCDPAQTRRFIRSPGWIGGTSHFHSGAGDSWSTLRVQHDHLPRVYHAWQLPERFVTESRHTISGEEALTCFLARCATGERWMTLEGVLIMVSARVDVRPNVTMCQTALPADFAVVVKLCDP